MPTAKEFFDLWTESKELTWKDEQMETAKRKTVNLQLEGLNGNAYALMGAFQSQARREGWTDDEIKAVLDECTSGDYDHLLQTLIGVCEPTEDRE